MHAAYTSPGGSPILGLQTYNLYVRVRGRAGKKLKLECYDVGGVKRLDHSYDITSDDQEFHILDWQEVAILADRAEGSYTALLYVYDPATGEVYESAAPRFLALKNLGTLDITYYLPEAKLVHAYIIDPIVGETYKCLCPPDSIPVCWGNYSTIVAYHSPGGEAEPPKTWMCAFYGPPEAPIEELFHDLGFSTYAIMEHEIQFRDDEALLAYLANRASRGAAIPKYIIDLVANPNITLDEKIAALQPYVYLSAVEHTGAKLLSLEVVRSSPPRLKFSYRLRPGFFDVDVSYAAALTAIQPTHPAGSPIAPIVAFLVGMLVGAGATVAIGKLFGWIRFPWDPPTEEEKRAVEQKGEEGKKHVDDAAEKAKGTVDELVKKGQVTPTAGEQIKLEIENVRVTAKRAIDEVVDEAKRQIDSAYWKGVWRGGAILGGIGLVGGGIGGYLLGTRAVPYIAARLGRA
jgi:polyhydroxyalkanoate synthesis regulator phasin